MRNTTCTDATRSAAWRRDWWRQLKAFTNRASTGKSPLSLRSSCSSLLGKPAVKNIWEVYCLEHPVCYALISTVLPSVKQR